MTFEFDFHGRTSIGHSFFSLLNNDLSQWKFKQSPIFMSNDLSWNIFKGCIETLPVISPLLLP